MVAGFRERFLAHDRAGYAGVASVIATLDLLPRIAGITAPTQIIVGADDPTTPVSMSERIRALIPHAEMIVIPKAAHMVVVEQADVVNGYIGAFLGRGDRREAPRTGGVAFAAGLPNRKAVLGHAHVTGSLAAAGDFAGPWQDFITRTVPGAKSGATRRCRGRPARCWFWRR